MRLSYRTTALLAAAMTTLGSMNATAASPATAAEARTARISIDAGRRIATVSEQFNGTNIEDINNQTNGGVFGQLLWGEAFEENMDVDFLNLKREDYSKVYVMLDEQRVPHLISQAEISPRINWNDYRDAYDVNSKDVYDCPPYKRTIDISGLRFTRRYMAYDSLPKAVQQEMMRRLKAMSRSRGHGANSLAERRVTATACCAMARHTSAAKHRPSTSWAAPARWG